MGTYNHYESKGMHEVQTTIERQLSRIFNEK